MSKYITIEHIKIINHLNVAEGMVVISKVDLVDPELMELAELEIHDAVQHTVFSGKPVIRFSATDSSGKDSLLSCIRKAIEKIPGKNPDAPFRMWIDEAIGAPGFGTVACGTVLSGTVSQDDPLCLLPLGRETRARSLEVHHRKAATAFAGQRVGINLPKISLKEVQRGMVLVKQNFKKNETQKILDFLHEQGKLIRLSNNNFLKVEALAEIKRRVRKAIDEKGSIRMTDSLDILGYGRSKAAPVFEYLDEIGFTRRHGDERRLADNQ